MARRNEGTSTEELERQMARVVCAQICKQAGFHAVRDSALNTLTEVMLRYMKLIGHAAHEKAEAQGRTVCNLHDVLVAFDSMGVNMKDLVEEEDETPFVHSEPNYPVRKRRKPTDTFLMAGEPHSRPLHIPGFLPKFPADHIVKATPVFEQANVDEKEARIGLLKQRQAGEDALLGLEERLAPAATTDYSASAIMEPARLEALRVREQREVTAEMPETVLTHRLMKVITAGAGAGAAEDGTGSARLGRARSDNTAAVKAAAAAARLAAPISGTVTDLEGAIMDAPSSVIAFHDPVSTVEPLETGDEERTLRSRRLDDQLRVIEMIDRDPNSDEQRAADPSERQQA